MGIIEIALFSAFSSCLQIFSEPPDTGAAVSFAKFGYAIIHFMQ